MLRFDWYERLVTLRLKNDWATWLSCLIFCFFNNENMLPQTNNYMRAWFNSYHIEKTTQKRWLVAIVIVVLLFLLHLKLFQSIKLSCEWFNSRIVHIMSFCLILTWKCWLVLLFIIDWVDWFDWHMIDLIDKIEIIPNLVCKNIDPNGKASLNTRH